MPLSVQRIHVHIGQHVVHPAHIPLVVEAETVAVLVGHAGERGALLGDHNLVAGDVRNRLTDLLKQRDRIEVFASAVDVRQPFAVAASVIEVQHAADRVDAQTVDVKLLEPVDRKSVV